MLNTNQLNTNRLNNLYITLGTAVTAATGRIIFDGFSLDNGTSLRLIDAPAIDSFTTREINVVNSARGNGQVIRSIYERIKPLNLTIGVHVETKEEMHALLDTISSRLMTTVPKNLRVNIDGVETRIYSAILVNGDSAIQRLKNPRNRGIMNLQFNCYTPFGRSINATEQFIEGLTSVTEDKIFENTGTAPSFLDFVFYINSANNLTEIEIQNLTTNQTLQIEATTTFAGGQIIIVKGDELTIELDGSTTGIDYSGSFLRLDPGRNIIRYNITSTSHNINISESTQFSFYRGG